MNSSFLALLKEAFAAWQVDKAARLGAALAYYAIFSLAPLLVIIIGIVGLLYGDVSGELEQQMAAALGPEAAKTIAEAIGHTMPRSGGTIATIIGVVTLLLGASGVFGQLQDAMNTIWHVKPKEGRGLKGMLQDRFLSFTMVLGTGFLLLISFVLSAALSIVSKFFQGYLPGDSAIVWQVVNFAASFAVISLLFAMIYKFLPDVKLTWNDVRTGAVVTALLFVLGKEGLGLYLGRSSIGSAYGVAGSLLVILVWIYYSAQILFFGAEFTKVYANRQGSHPKPEPTAISTEAPAVPPMPLLLTPPPSTPVTRQPRPKTLTPAGMLLGLTTLILGMFVGRIRLPIRRRRRAQVAPTPTE